MGERLLVYALGGGAGHLTRGLAIGRIAAKRGFRVHVLSNSPHTARVNVVEELGDGGILEILPRDVRKHGLISRVHQLLALDWDALVVDTFPRGLLGELAGPLPELRFPKFWVHRDLSPVYAHRFGLREFARHFDAIFAPGEVGAIGNLPGRVVETAPWLVRDPEELCDRTGARTRLGVDRQSGPLVAVLGSGTVGESVVTQQRCDRLRQGLDPDIAVHSVGPGLELSHWPLLECMRGIDVVVGTGGYNTVQETRATGTTLLAVPQTRLYDRQSHRLEPTELVTDEGLTERIVAELRNPSAPRSSYPNGVHTAVDVIEDIVRGRVSERGTFGRES